MQRSITEQQDRLHQTFTAALDLLDKENREPDRWEEECLSYALGAMACGLYLAAEVELAAFARPLEQRSPEELAVLAKKPRRFTKSMLRHGLDYVLNRDNIDIPPPAVDQRAVRAFLGASL
jgi:triphosphoribosyl-dephospho-CoA synthetase